MNLFLLLSAVTFTIYIPSPYRTTTGTLVPSIDTCTAVAISTDTLLTAAHCLEGKKGEIVIKHHPKCKVQVIKQDSEKDLAVLKVKGLKLQFVSIGLEPKQTDRVYTVNSGHGYENTYEEGYIQNIYKDDKADKYPHIKSSILILSGASGSGLFDTKGNLIGINVVTMENGSLVIDTKTIREFLNVK